VIAKVTPNLVIWLLSLAMAMNDVELYCYTRSPVDLILAGVFAVLTVVYFTQWLVEVRK